jgi:hypothetical protein
VSDTAYESACREIDDLKEAIKAIVKTNNHLVIPMYVWETVNACVPDETAKEDE